MDSRDNALNTPLHLAAGEGPLETGRQDGPADLLGCTHPCGVRPACSPACEAAVWLPATAMSIIAFLTCIMPLFLHRCYLQGVAFWTQWWHWLTLGQTSTAETSQVGVLRWAVKVQSLSARFGLGC